MTTQDAAIVADGIHALRRFIDKRTVRMDELSESELLTLRSGMTLCDRLELCVQMNAAVSAALFSPTDVFALRQIQKASPGVKNEIDALARLINLKVMGLD